MEQVKVVLEVLAELELAKVALVELMVLEQAKVALVETELILLMVKVQLLGHLEVLLLELRSEESLELS
jgi:hypothetical protein